MVPFGVTEATKASKQPQRSNLKSVTSITYISMCILLMWSLMMASEATTASKTASEVKSDL